MSEEMHTKGEWSIGESDSTKVWSLSEKTCVAWSTNDAQHKDFYIDKSFEEMKANARLISAAPDLLHACQVALKTLNSNFCDGAATFLIRQAIKKALP